MSLNVIESGSTLSVASRSASACWLSMVFSSIGTMSDSRSRTATLVMASGRPDSSDHAAAHSSGCSAPQANAFFRRAT